MLSLRQREQRQAWVLLAPMLLVMLLLTAWPLLRTIWLSFTDAALIGSGETPAWIGLENYLYALSDPDFGRRSGAHSISPLCLSPLKGLSACWWRCC